MEKLIWKYNSDAEIRKVCEDNQVFQQPLEKSIAPAKELIEEVFQRLSMKEKPFKLYSPAEDKEIEDFKVIAEKLGTFPSSAESGPVAEFYETHCVKRTDLFQVKKCTDKQCRFHAPLNSVEEIEDFPDPIPYEVNGIPHYKKGTNPEEKNIPSLLLDVSKGPHNIPFPLTAQPGKNVGMLVKCVEYKKPRLMHSKTELKLSECNVLERSLSGLQYFCGAAFSSTK